MINEELILEGEEAEEFEEALKRGLSSKEIKELEEAEEFYKKHCRL